MVDIHTITNLLAQSEGTDNKYEAETFWKQAQLLATKKSIDLEAARKNLRNRGKRETPIHRTIQIGEHGKRGLKHFVNLFWSIAENNDVKFDIPGRVSEVIAYGFPSDIDMSEELYGILAIQMVQDCNTYLNNEDEWRSDTYRVWDKEQRKYIRKSINKWDARKSFYQSFSDRVYRRMEAGRRESEKQEYSVTDEHGNSVQQSGELVLVDKRNELRDYYSNNTIARGIYQTRSAINSVSSSRAGDRAGTKAKMHTDPKLPGERPALEDR